MLFKKKDDKIIIIGLNEISIILAKKLSYNKDVVILDNISHLKENNYNYDDLDVIIEKLDSGLITSLKEYEINKSVLLISITDSNEFNVFTAELGKKLGAKKSLAIVYDDSFINSHFNIDLIINPYQIISDKISMNLQDTRLFAVQNIVPAELKISSIIVKNNDLFSYIKLKDLELKEGLVIGVKRGNKYFLPDVNTRFFPGDQIFLLFKKSMIKNYFKLLNFNKSLNKKLFIFGGKELGLYFIEYLGSMFNTTVIIEADLQQCNYLASKLEKTLILNGDGEDLQLLKEEGFDNKSIFLAISNEDSRNIISSLGAKYYLSKDIITLINHPNHLDIARLLNLNCIFSKADIIADYILDFYHKGLSTNNFFPGSEIYASRISIKEDSIFLNKKISELNIPSEIIIGVLLREDNIIIPGGEDILKKGDLLIVFFNKKYESEISSIF
jgi:trk system potassium uptake protein